MVSRQLDPATVEETIVRSGSSTITAAAAIATHENNNNKTMITVRHPFPQRRANAAASHEDQDPQTMSNTNDKMTMQRLRKSLSDLLNLNLELIPLKILLSMNI